MTNSTTRPRASRDAAVRASCLLGLALCVHASTSEAQARAWAPWGGHTYDRESERHEIAADPEDPDLVRAGVFATLAEALAEGATMVSHGEADVDGDGRVDRMLVVTPRRDPYPFNQASGLVLARSLAGGWRVTVVARGTMRDPASDYGADRCVWMPPVVGRQGALLVVDVQEFVSHDPHDYFVHGATFLRVDPAGRLWEVGRQRASEDGSQDARCFATRYRYVGDGVVRGDGYGCRPIRLERVE